MNVLNLHRVSKLGEVLTDLLVMLFGFQADDLQDAGAGDVRHHVGYALPHTQQSTAQHVVLTESHALQTLLTFLYFLTLPVPTEKDRKEKVKCFMQARNQEPARFLHFSLCWKVLEVQVISS